jgi:hypothetical protein
MGERLQPLGAGADVVLHSATKYLGGHSDLMLGAAVAWDDELTRRLRERRLLTGAIPLALSGPATGLASPPAGTPPAAFARLDQECLGPLRSAIARGELPALAPGFSGELASKFTDFRDSTAAPAA